MQATAPLPLQWRPGFLIILSVLLVVPTAYWIRLRLPQLRTMIEFITMLPFVIPAIVLVVGILVFRRLEPRILKEA